MKKKVVKKVTKKLVKVKCNCSEFICNQTITLRVIVDNSGEWIKDIEGSCSDSEDPVGPYTCVNCGKVFHTEYNGPFGHTKINVN
jgi:hypothetical protein